MVVAVAALVAAIGGTAVASVATISKLSKSEKKQVRKIASAATNRSISSRAGGLSVAHARSADSAGSATSADSAKTAAQAGHAATADQATDAAAVGGVRTVKVDVSGSTDTTRPILAEGGITMEAMCNAGQAEVVFKPTPGNGVLSVGRFKESGEVDNLLQRTFDTQMSLSTVNFNNLRALTLAVDYVGTDGTTITGDIVMAQEGAIAPCVLGGTLFVRS
jgi:hypothetical protein